MLLGKSPSSNEQTTLWRFRLHTVLLLLLLLVTGTVFVWSADRYQQQPPPPTKPEPLHPPAVPHPPLAHTPTAASLGFAHIYIIHDPLHPQRLQRMTQLLQFFRLEAEFVTATDPFLSRLQVYQDIRLHGYASALILDDSVDMELNIRMLMRVALQNLPRDWDMFFPGHCGAFEGTQEHPSPGMPGLRVANMPICLHAHAVSLKGAGRIVRHVRSPSQDIMEMAIMRLKERRLIHMYSLDVPVFTPRPGTEEPKKLDRMAGNKRLAISAISHLSLWQGKTNSILETKIT
ncbi:hypothetical protein GGH95_005060 [Coemansia sp. RSA 1836]|nr:hypothetical protein GGH95_005060 [Coemansia sp. RSA 1836]